MKRLITLLFGFMTMTMSLMAAVTPTAPSVGDGSVGNPYKIGTPAELLWFQQRSADYYNICAILINDIDLSSVCNATDGNWIPIGVSTNPRFYGGTFDGNGHSISNLYIHLSEESPLNDNKGLFGTLKDATIKNLTLLDVDINVNSKYVGAVSGSDNSSTSCNTISNVRVTGTISGNNNIAGIIGTVNRPITIENCVNEANCNGSDNQGCIAGIVGWASNTDVDEVQIIGCLNKGDITSKDLYVGGIMGRGTATLQYCMNTGKITGDRCCAGMIGGLNVNKAVIKNCLNTGNIEATSNSASIGHIVGGNWNEGCSLEISDCYYLETATRVNSECEIGNEVNPFYADLYHKIKLSLGTMGTFTAAQLASGYAAYILQGYESTTHWGQKLSTEVIPTPQSSNRVFVTKAMNCNGETTGSFTNTANNISFPTHAYSNGICSVCGEYEKPEFTEEGIWLIDNAGQLAWLSDNHCFANIYPDVELTNDIDLSYFGESNPWKPIGTNSANRFTGTFNGNDHTISNIYLKSENDNLGLFGYIRKATISNLKVANLGGAPYCVVRYAGTIGYAETSTISNIHVLSGKIDAYSNVGGVVGYATKSTITNCSNNAVVSGSYGDNGGIAGYINASILSFCVNTADLAPWSQNVGGIVGTIRTSKVSDCLNTGNLISPTDCEPTGGIAGFMDTSSELSTCLTTGDVTNWRPDYDDNALIVGCETTEVLSISRCYASGTLTLNQKVVTASEGELVNCKCASKLGDVSVEKVTAEQLRNGYVAYNLQFNREDDFWGQQLGVDQTPVLHGQKVYLDGTLKCNGEYKSGSFTNTMKDTKQESHKLDADGVCTACGNGETPEQTEGIYQIAKVGHLVWFRDRVNKNEPSIKAEQTADLDLTNVCNKTKGSWTPIGSSQTFTGSYDGQNHAIRNLYINGENNFQALFGNVQGTIMNLTVQGDVTGKCQVALVAGWTKEGSLLQNITTEGNVTGANEVGGLAGIVRYTTIVDCHNKANINGNDYTAGIAGDLRYSNSDSGIKYVANCTNSGKVQCTNETATYGYVGGIGGFIEHINLTNCANYGDIKGKSYVGGIAGRYNNGKMTNCFSSGNVEGNQTTTSVSMISTGNGTLVNCYADGTKYVKTTDGYMDLSDETNCVIATQEQLLSGEIAYRLGEPYGQIIGTDKLPYLNHAKVYYGAYTCGNATPAAEPKYSNKPIFETATSHTWGNYSKCTNCGKHDVEAHGTKLLPDWESTNHDDRSTGTNDMAKYTFDADYANGDVISFDWIVSSELNYDKLSVYLYKDGSKVRTLLDQVSGDKSGNVNYRLIAADGAGTFALLFEYFKDSSTSKLDDKGIIKNIVVPGPVPVAATGDLTGNGEIDMEDLTMLCDILREEDNDPYHKSDVNCDGQCDLLDVQALMNMILGK